MISEIIYAIMERPMHNFDSIGGDIALSSCEILDLHYF
jgi:hypothetical protein